MVGLERYFLYNSHLRNLNKGCWDYNGAGLQVKSV